MNPYRKLMDAIVTSYQIEKDLRRIQDCPNHASLTAEVKRLSREKKGEFFKTYAENVSFLCIGIQLDHSLGFYISPSELKDYYPIKQELLSNQNEEHRAEKKVLDLLVNAHNLYCDLPATHIADQVDWTFHLHSLQRILMARITREDYPVIFRSTTNHFQP